MRVHSGIFLIFLLGMLALAGCNLSTNQLRSNLPVDPLATATVQLAVTPGPQRSTPIQAPARLTRTVGAPDEFDDLIPTSDSMSVEIPVNQNIPQVEACSPLAGISLEELPAIVSSPYDPPPAGKEDRHHGVDFAYYRREEQPSIQGTRVQAIFPGVVAMALTESFPYGNVVIIESGPVNLPDQSANVPGVGVGESLYTLYAHLEESPQVQVGQDVNSCQMLGEVGKSGNAGVAHLHLETRVGPAGISFDQIGYYLAESTSQEKENYLRWRIGGEFLHFDPMTILLLDDLP